MKYEIALPIAERLKSEFAPFCHRIEIAGSIRRKKPEVKDIELVCIPNKKELIGFITAVKRYPKLKGEPTGKYTQRLITVRPPEVVYLDEINLDLFITTPEQWGLIYAMRTGSADFSHKVLENGWVKAGFHSMKGMLVKGFHKYPVHEEQELFDLIGIPYIEPEYREYPLRKSPTV